MKTSVRTHVMKENFMFLHNNGHDIAEIAAKYELSAQTVYRHLQEIADANGVTRESLLQVLRTPTERQLREESERTMLNVAELQKGFSDIHETIQRVIDKIDDIIKEEEECLA